MTTRFIILIVVPLLIAGCTSNPTQKKDRTTDQSNSLTLYESRLLEVIEKERELNTMASDSRISMAEVQRKFLQVARNYNSIIADNPQNLEAHLLYGKLLARFGDMEGARNAFLNAAQINPQAAVIHQQLGNYYAEQNDPTRALAYFLNAVDLEPKEPAYHFGLGDLIYNFKDELIATGGIDPKLLDEQMLKAFKSAADLDPSNPIFQFRYGECFYDVRNPDWNMAIQHWESLPSKFNLTQIQDAAIRLHVARCLLGLKEYDSAIKVARTVILPGLIQTRISLIDQIRQVRKKDEQQTKSK